MGGAAPTPSGKGGKKSLDASINLVPFIDLLSCCISFLLITAVWTQLARIDVTQKGGGAAGSSEEKPQEKQVQLTLFIDKDGYTFAKSTGETVSIPLKNGEYDLGRLGEVLANAKREHPDKNDITIKSDDTVIYNKIIATMDVTLSSKFPDIGLADKGGG